MDGETILKGLAVVTPVAGALGFVYRRFRKSGTDELESFGRYLTQGLKFYVGRYVRRRLAGELTLRQYARVNLRSTALKMPVPARYPVALDTDRVFVPLLLRNANRNTVDYQDLAEQAGSRTVVIGEPGSGKSSLMKRTFRDACRRAVAQPASTPLPLLYELRSLAHLGEQLDELSHEELLAECMRSLDDTAIYRTETSALDLQYRGGFLLLLDGLDEVPREASPRVVHAISELGKHLSRQSPNSSVIVSTRTQHYLSIHDREFEEAFNPLSIRPFSVADIYRFLLSWPFRKERSKHVARLFTRIRQLPSLSEMCSNPLALAMFVARDQQTEGEASPETRSAFYGALMEEFLVNRRYRRDEPGVGRQRLLRTRERILGKVCLDHLLDPDEALNSISERRMLQGVEDAGVSADEAPEVLEALAIDTGLFSPEREGETYRFMHLTFCEFFAATAVVNRGEGAWQELSSRLAGQGGTSDDNWRSRLGEVVAFTSGRAPDSLSDAVVRDIREDATDSLVLRAALEAQNYNNSNVLAAIAHEALALAEVEPSGWDVAWFSRLRWLLAVQRDIAAASHPEFAADEEARVLSPSEFLIGLIERYGAADLLLGSLCKVDVEAAIDIADGRSNTKLMDVVALGADDFGTLFAILSRYESGVDLWGPCLIHCALRESQLAHVLAETGGLVTPPPGEKRWQAWFMFRHSVYSRLLDQVLQRPDTWRDEDKAILRYLGAVKVPSSELTEPIRLALLASVIPILGVMSLFMLSEVVARRSWLSSVLALIAVVPPLFVLLRVVAEPLRRLVLRRVEAQGLEISVGAVSVTLEGGAGVKFSQGPSRVQRSRLRRSAILKEVLNLGEYRFPDEAGAEGDGAEWMPKPVTRFVTGVQQEDIQALIEARRIRGSSDRQTIEARV